jgi:hypothetical protein
MDFNPFFLVKLTVIFFVAIACAQNVDEEVVDILDNNYESSNSNDITTTTNNNSNNINDIINNIDNNKNLENVDALSTSSSEEYFEQSLDQNDHLSSIPTISTEGEFSVMSFYFTTVLLLLTD